MPRYTVNATMTVAAWINLEAETPEEALAEATDLSAWAWDTDMATAEFENAEVEPDDD